MRVVFIVLVLAGSALAQYQQISAILRKCHRKDKNFDNCMKKSLNSIRPYFKQGIPEMGIPPFDPHFAELVEQKRGGVNANYHLKLKNVYERGWTISKVTDFKTDWKNNRIIYSQYFPEKALNGDYEVTTRALGATMERAGVWNMTLYDYSQTTTITRSPLGDIDVKVAIDRIGDMQLHISNIIDERNTFIETIADAIINASWRPGFVVVKPLINDLVSTAFTKIWGDAFHDFPFEQMTSE